MWYEQVLDNRVVVLMDPAKINQEVDPLRVNRTREKRFVLRVSYPVPRVDAYTGAVAIRTRF